MSLSRTEKAGAGNFGLSPHWYRHAPLTGKPASGVVISGLTADEQTTINAWISDHDAGLPTPFPDHTYNNNTAFSGTANTKVADLVTYFASAVYLAWQHQDRIWRESQWRLDNVDAIETAHANATVSISRDPAGAGSGSSNSIGQSPTTPISQCTSAGDWTAFAATATIAATARAITVPAGNSGNLRIAFSKNSCTLKYSKNGGAYSTVTNNQIITVVNTDTINFEITGASAGSEAVGTVYDNDTGLAVGVIDIESNA